jgi:hypothetical protein
VFPIPCSLFPVPYSLFPVPCSVFPIPYSLLPGTRHLTASPPRIAFRGSKVYVSRQPGHDYGKSKEWAKKREDIYTWLWIWSGRVARFTFPGGIGLLVFFAVKNR